MEKNDKIYVAGHTGLVGSALWKNLLSKGYTNLCGKTIDELDLMDTRAVNQFFAEEKPDYVILAAAKVGGIVANSTYRGQFIYENLMIQNNVIHAAYLHKVKKLLFLGSTCIYPRDAPQPMAEDCLLTSPLEYTNEPYAIAKIAGVKMCESYNLQYGTNFISVMPTNLYGPNDNFDLEKSHVLPGLLRKVHLGKCLEEGDWDAIREDLRRRPIVSVSGGVEDEKMGRWEGENDIIKILSKYGVSINSEKNVSVEIWGTGAPMREFLWSEEMADACVYLMEKVDFSDVAKSSVIAIRQLAEKQPAVSPQPSHEVRNTHINIGTGKEISIKNLAFLIKEKVGFRGELVFNASKPDGTMRKLTDPSKIHSLGWHHKIEIDEGIEKLYSWYLKK